jgi:hypothetical protein
VNGRTGWIGIDRNGRQRLDLEHVRVLRAVRAQERGQAAHVVEVRSARTDGAAHLARDRGGRGGAEPVRIAGRRDVEEPPPARAHALWELELAVEALVPAALAVVELVEDGGRAVGRERVRQAEAARAGLAHQRHDPAGRARDAAVIGRALPEAAREALDGGGSRLFERELGAPDERAVAEDPDAPGIRPGARRGAHPMPSRWAMIRFMISLVPA